MSSFLGLWNPEPELKQKVQELVPDPGVSVENDHLFLLGKDAAKHTFHSFANTPDAGWMVAGIGLSHDENPMVLDQYRWDELIKNKSLEDLNGHYALCTWEKESVSLYTDPVGLRNIFLFKHDESVLFSTRLDWLLELIPEVQLEWTKFGSTWMGVNPFSQDCFYKGVERLCQGGKAVITPESYHLEHHPWTPGSVIYNRLEDALNASTLAAGRTFSNISLGLSGGLDSRVLLSILSGNHDHQDFSLYTIDMGEHPDSKYASELSRSLDVTHEFITPPEPTPHEFLSELTELNLRSMLNTSPFELQVIKGYQGLGQQGYVTIDGMSGEIARRRYFRSLEIKAKEAIHQKDGLRLFPYLYSNRADIFTEEVSSQMEQGMKEELQRVIDPLPDPAEFGIANWLDLFSIRTRIPGQVGIKQEYIDTQLFHLMPFIQPSVLNTLFSTSPDQRRNAQVLRSVIKKNTPAFTAIPLVKGDDVYPYWMKDFSSLIWGKLKRRFGTVYHSDRPVQTMLGLEEPVKDLFRSAEVTEYAAYDTVKINRLINSFYDKQDYSLAQELSWLFSFELVRRKLNLS